MADKRLSKKRIEMGEEAWSEYQKKRNNNKANKYSHSENNIRKVVEWRRRVKLKLIEYKGGKCEICGYDKQYPNCYDFHHINPEEKDFSISGKTKKFERLKEEVNKCQLLCKNCHAEIHDKIYTSSRESTISKYSTNTGS